MGPLYEPSKIEIAVLIVGTCFLGWAAVESVAYVIKHISISWS